MSTVLLRVIVDGYDYLYDTKLSIDLWTSLDGDIKTAYYFSALSERAVIIPIDSETNKII